MTEKKWFNDFHGVPIILEPKIIRVRAYSELKDYFSSEEIDIPFGRRSHELAKYAREQYFELYGEQIKITTASLASEIRWHFFFKRSAVMIKNRFHFLYKIPPIKEFIEKVIVHMNVIDCGERSVDGNRKIWDVMQVFEPIMRKTESIR